MHSLSYILFCGLCALFYQAQGHPLCLDTNAPSYHGPLSYCSVYAFQPSCCTNATDFALEQIFEVFNVSSVLYPDCYNILSKLTCSQCDPFAAHLYGLEDLNTIRPVPWLCPDYCNVVYTACRDVPVFNSPFNPLRIATPWSINSTYVISTNFPTSESFCQAFVPNNLQYCFSGYPYDFNYTVPPSTASAVNSSGDYCLDRVIISPSSPFLYMLPHPDGSGKLAFSTRDGRIMLYSNSPDWQRLDSDASPFFDITPQHTVVDSGEKAFLSFAFHPDYMTNGRLFVHYSCGNCHWSCSQGCVFSSCNTATDTCNNVDHISSVSEYRVANLADIGTSREHINCTAEYKKVLTLAQPYANHNGGLLLFSPVDKYMYVFFGDGGAGGDPFNFGQNMHVFFAKILRIDVDSEPDPGLGYHIPVDNPFTSITVQGQPARGEIWALGMRNPWRCNFDSADPSRLYCGDVGQGDWEWVNLIQRGGNFGWSRYEGVADYKSYDPQSLPSFQISPHIEPLLTYPHDPQHGSGRPQGVCVIGGFISHSPLDECNNGRYVFADLNGLMYIGNGFPNNPSIEMVQWHCASYSNLPCTDPQGRRTDSTGASLDPSLALTNLQVWSFAQDKDGVLFVLSDSGVYRIVNQSRCGASTCIAKAPYVSPEETKQTVLIGAVVGSVLFVAVAVVCVIGCRKAKSGSTATHTKLTKKRSSSTSTLHTTNEHDATELTNQTAK